MDYKEKYEMALEGIQEILGSGEDFIKMSRLQLRLQGIFPELKESEDERMVKFIKNQLFNIKKTITDNYKLDTELTKAIDWLERGEQKPIGKVEPKFHEGEWIIRSAEGFKHNTYLVKEVKDYYACEDLKGQRVTFTLNDVHKNFKLWDISDAKDGDILAVEPINDYPSPFIAICKERGLDFFNSHCFISFDAKFYTGDTGHDIIGIHPATKEQRHTLEKAMADAGWEFDFKKKELKKIEQNKPTDKKASLTDVEKSILNFADYFHTNRCKPESEWVDEIKMLRDYIPSRILKPTEWSEEDKDMINTIISDLKRHGGDTTYSAEVDWLKQFQPKQEWSEEDEEMLNLIIARLHSHPNVDLEEYSKEYDWLNYNPKSLRPHSQWKPSEEQLKSLKGVIDVGYFTSYPNSLETLYEQLKKLMEK